MEPISITGLVSAIIFALILGLVVAIITYLILWLVSLVVRLEEGSRRRIAAIVGALVALLSLLGYFS